MTSESLSDADFAKRVGIPLTKWLAVARRGAPVVHDDAGADFRPWPQTLHWWVKAQVDNAHRVVPEDANQTDFAAIIGVSSRQVHNLLSDGLPANGSGKRTRRVPIAKGVQWYLERKQLEAAGDETDELEMEKLKKMRADRALSELNLAERQRKVLDADDVVREIEELFAGINGVLRTLTDRMSPRLVGIGDEQSVRELMDPELQKAAQRMTEFAADYASRAATISTEVPPEEPDLSADDGNDT